MVLREEGTGRKGWEEEGSKKSDTGRGRGDSSIIAPTIHAICCKHLLSSYCVQVLYICTGFFVCLFFVFVLFCFRIKSTLKAHSLMTTCEVVVMVLLYK